METLGIYFGFKVVHIYVFAYCRAKAYTIKEPVTARILEP